MANRLALIALAAVLLLALLRLSACTAWVQESAQVSAVDAKAAADCAERSAPGSKAAQDARAAADNAAAARAAADRASSDANAARNALDDWKGAEKDYDEAMFPDDYKKKSLDDARKSAVDLVNATAAAAGRAGNPPSGQDYPRLQARADDTRRAAEAAEAKYAAADKANNDAYKARQQAEENSRLADAALRGKKQDVADAHGTPP